MDKKSGDNMECAAVRMTNVPLDEMEDEDLVWQGRATKKH